MQTINWRDNRNGAMTWALTFKPHIEGPGYLESKRQRQGEGNGIQMAQEEKARNQYRVDRPGHREETSDLTVEGVTDIIRIAPYRIEHARGVGHKTQQH